jgi:two-component sensor histidine kinase
MYEILKPQIDLVLSGQESTSEMSLTRRDGTVHHFFRHLYPHRSVDGVVKGYFSALIDISEAKVTQESQLRQEHLLRSTLVREINHRVKNSLQGLIGIMRMHEARQLHPTPLIDQCVSQLMAVAVAFGLASKHGEARILLCDLVRDVAQSVEQVSGRRILIEILPGVDDQPVPLAEQHGVNVSLVINELIFNAIKHSRDTSDVSGVRVQVDRIDDIAILRVVNATGRLPEHFSFSAGVGLGTGLSLVKVLVPPDSCELSITQETEGVVARLQLKAPVLTPD